jgi:hypothetical protein
MRFFEDGPDIPDSLIEARELGEVVFFCGAGVSAPAGLPDFNGLADDLLAELTAQESREAREAKESLDRVFSAMIKEFGRAAVDREITRALRTPRKADLRYHDAIIALSRGTDGAAKIVTTNFDLLFERAGGTLRRYVPPALPDLVQAQPIDGIVYLHGRLNSAQATSSGYVISSADFGRAYLAEGWASRFVRELRERYTIVLLGYSANDPPMRYLLEGLSSREGAERSPIYAFATEGSSASDEAWRDKGVTTIPYAPRDRGHGGLWDTLFAWAEAARDPDAWQARLVALAQRQPAGLRPFERGQVVHLVGSKAGASAFASARPIPPAEWLCVLDANRRYSEPAKKDWDDNEDVDPLEIFGLDGDPPRPQRQPGGGIEPPGADALRWRPGDETWSDRQRLSGYHPQWSDQLPSRLYHLARWFGTVLDQPAAIWWAAFNTLPHPGLVREIQSRLDRGGELPGPVTHFWRCFLEAVRARQADMHDLRLYEAAERIASEGWSNAVLRAIERALEPIFEIGRPTLGAPVPPAESWDDLRLLDVVEIKVSVTRWADSKLKPPSEALPALVAILRRTLVRMSKMFDEGTPSFRRTPTLHHSGESGESAGHGRKDSLFRQFKIQFDALVQRDRELALSEVAAWDSNDRFYFAKLFLYAAWLPGLLDPGTVAKRILAMPDAVFWDSDHSREMLFALRAKWSAFGPRQRHAIERRIAGGPPSYEGEPRKDYRTRRGARAASWLRWLELNGRALSPAGSAQLQKLKTADPRWSDSWAAHADDSMSSWGGMISRVTDPQGLEKTPISDLLTLAASLSVDDHRQLKDYRPFDGVVEVAPFRALSALRLVARKGEHPIGFWRSLTSNWPEGTRPRLSRLLAHTLARLPAEVFADLRYDVAGWTTKFVEGLIRHDRRSGLIVFDAIVARYMAGPDELLVSSVGTATVGGMPKIESEYSIMKAINSPGGDLALVLIHLLNNPKRRRPMPAYIGTRLDRLLNLPGHGAGHAGSVIARQFRWLEYWYPGWVDHLVQLFDPGHALSEAMWHGLAADQNLLSDAAGTLLKPALLRTLAGDAAWSLDHEAKVRLVQQMTNLTFTRGGKAVISYPEARRALMAVNDQERSEAISMLARSMGGEGMWSSFVKPFLLGGWPRQLRYQGEASSRAFASLVEAAGDRFEEVLDIVEDYLRPVAHLDTFAFRMTKDDSDGRNYSGRFPAATLRMLDALVGPDRQTAPWNLGELLETIATAAPALRQSDPWRRLKALTQ